MKEKNIYKSIIKDVIIASGGEITDECFNKLQYGSFYGGNDGGGLQ